MRDFLRATAYTLTTILLTAAGALSLQAQNVGIGTTSPAAKLDVRGRALIGTSLIPDGDGDNTSNLLNLLADNTNSPRQNGLTFYENKDGYGLSLSYDGSGTGDQNALRVYNNSNSSIFTFENGGNIGIGDAQPQNKLDIDIQNTGYVSGISFDSEVALSAGSEWLRLNQNENFTKGVYIPSKLRVDGGLRLKDLNASTGHVLYSQDNAGNAQWKDPASLTTDDEDWTVNAPTMHMNSSLDRVGVGTSSPSGNARLTIKGPSGDGGLKVTNASGGADSWLPYSNGDIYLTGDLNQGSGAIIFRNYDKNRSDAYQEQARVSAGGNLGIGESNPAAPLEVAASNNNGPTILAGRKSGNPNIRASTDGTGHLIMDSRDESNGDATYVSLNHYYSGDVVLGNGGGNAGIGSKTPGERLEVDGNIMMKDGGDAYLKNDDGYVGIRPNAATHGLILRDHEAGKSSTWTGLRTVSDGGSGQDRLEFAVNNSGDYGNSLVVTDNNNVGVGTDAPQEELHTTGDLRVGSSVINSGTDELKLMRDVNAANDNDYEWVGFYSGTNREGIILYDGQWSGGNNIQDEFSLTAESGNKLTLNTDGNDVALMPDGSGKVGVNKLNPQVMLHVNGRMRTNGINETSDRRLKRGIQTVDNAIGTVMQLRGVRYRWRRDEFPNMRLNKGPQYGLIAQEVEKVLPELVHEDGEGYKAVESTQLLGVMVEAMKDQQRTIQRLRSRVQQQSAQLEAIRQALDRHNIEVSAAGRHQPHSARPQARRP
jgi:hypothetical protein